MIDLPTKIGRGYHKWRIGDYKTLNMDVQYR